MEELKDGWIRLYRKSLKSSVWQNPVAWRVWCWCLLKVNHTDKIVCFNGKDIEIKAGQFITGRSKATIELLTNPQPYRTAISYLKSTNRITTKITNQYTIISVINWQKYQSQEVITNQPNNQQTNQPANQPPTSQLTTNKNEYKNDKNELQEVSPNGEPSPTASSISSKTMNPILLRDESEFSDNATPVANYDGDGQIAKPENKANQNKVWNKFVSYWKKTCLEIHRIDPEVSMSKDKPNFHRIYKLYGQDRMQDITLFFLRDKKSEEHLTISACFSADTINKWKKYVHRTRT